VFNVIIAAHGEISHAYVSACEDLLGKQDKLWSLAFDGDTTADQRHKLKDLLNHIPANERVVILCDLLGGTPADTALSFMDRDNVEVITGVNLPLLIKILTLRDQQTPETYQFDHVVHEASLAGQQAIQIASHVLKARLA